MCQIDSQGPEAPNLLLLPCAACGAEHPAADMVEAWVWQRQGDLLGPLARAIARHLDPNLAFVSAYCLKALINSAKTGLASDALYTVPPVLPLTEPRSGGATRDSISIHQSTPIKDLPPMFRFQVPTCRADLVIHALDTGRSALVRKLGNATVAQSRVEMDLLRNDIAFLDGLIERLDNRRKAHTAL